MAQRFRELSGPARLALLIGGLLVIGLLVALAVVVLLRNSDGDDTDGKTNPVLVDDSGAGPTGDGGGRHLRWLPDARAGHP